MRARLRTTAGQLEDGTTAEIVAKAEAETAVEQPAASAGSAAVEYTGTFFLGSKSPWFEITDDLPRFDEHPT